VLFLINSQKTDGFILYVERDIGRLFDHRKNRMRKRKRYQDLPQKLYRELELRKRLPRV
jgi:hypothetical protein